MPSRCPSLGRLPIKRRWPGAALREPGRSLAFGTGNGFRFHAYDPWQFFGAVVRAAETYRHPSLWAWLIRRAMTEDVSWSRSADRYVQLYLAGITARRERRGVPSSAAPVGKKS